MPYVTSLKIEFKVEMLKIFKEFNEIMELMVHKTQEDMKTEIRKIQTELSQ